MSGPGATARSRHHNPGSASYDARTVEQEQSDKKDDEDDEIDEESALMVAPLVGVGAWKFEPKRSLSDGAIRSVIQIPAQTYPVKQCEAQAYDGQHHRRNQQKFHGLHAGLGPALSTIRFLRKYATAPSAPASSMRRQPDCAT